MGPPGTEPLFPMYDIIDTRHRDDVVMRGMRLWGDYFVGFVKDCNWLQPSAANSPRPRRARPICSDAGNKRIRGAGRISRRRRSSIAP